MGDGDNLQHIKDVELMILSDFSKICDENDIEYYLIYGTQIGAIRHQGFIPWDDDVDVLLFRKDYEKFLNVMEDNPNEKYTIFDSRYNSEYFFQFGRMSLNDTYWAEYWDEQVSFKLGIHIDLFILDNLPDNKFKRKLFIQRCYYLARLYSISVLKFDNYSKGMNFILNCAHNLLNLINITPGYFQKKLSRLFRKYESSSGEYVTDLTLMERVTFKKDDYKPPKKIKFENLNSYIPNNDFNTLNPIYGDYMQLPPEEERVAHVLNEIDFGEY
ncbi:phosphorylcholine transferase LicD [Methanobrevibacter sp.]|uniref:LicD family protein n=1 Tax=Methanobrevibacter sp. TaxID=66852 RepID=UPI0025F150CC|nr:LicD family protein [Methanobrevibacter sp.]MBQ2832651.1 LicD family protein [Methanobrevibacter sp.]